MSTVDALEKYACPACGAQAEWHPGRQMLRCPYCLTESPYQVDRDTGKVQEIDLVTALREIRDDQRGWEVPRVSVRCQSCNAVSVFEEGRVGQRCDFCGSPALVPYSELKPPIRPQSLLPFRVSTAQVRDGLRKWFASRWFAPGKLKRKALVDQVAGMYVPFWTFDANVDCPWTAEAGHYYYTTESYRDSNGKMQTRQVRHIRWESAAGRFNHVFDDELVPGSQGLRTDLLASVEPFATRELVPYDSGYLSGFVVEHYRVVLIDAAKRAREGMHAKLLLIAAQQVPGDTHRNLAIYPAYSGETFKHVLLPVWLLTYDYGRRKFQVLVNGHSGKTAGDYPKSGWKIAAAILTVLVVLTLIMILAGR